jgi:SAM-dependent methyltransferase
MITVRQPFFGLLENEKSGIISLINREVVLGYNSIEGEHMEPTNFHAMTANAAHKNYSVAGKTVLEIASDPWLYSALEFKALGAGRVIASDMRDDWLRVPSNPDVETCVIDARDIPSVLGERAVDVIYGINLIEHLSDIPKALDSIDRALRPGGFAFLHGHPLWTSARGHHVMLGYVGGDVRFGTDTDPIPKWGHLYMTPESLTRHLQDLGKSKDVIDACVLWAFNNDQITRAPRNTVLSEFRRYAQDGGLTVRAIWEDRLEPPSAEDLRAIQTGKWWDETEDYAVRAMSILLDKRK